MKINGYELNYTEKELDKKLNKEMIIVELISKEFEGYKALKDGDKKALQHLVNAAKILNNVALEQDHPLNLIQKRELEKAAKTSSLAAKSLRLFNSLNGVEGTNGIDKEPVKIFKGISAYQGKNLYPTDLTPEEFHNILFEMLKAGKTKEVAKILSARTMVRRKNKLLEAIDYIDFFKADFAKAAKELELASKLVTNKKFKEYLEKQAKAFLKADEKLDCEADKTWAEMQDTDLEFTIGRENYDDDMTPTVYDNKKLIELLEKNKIEATAKDIIGVRVGIVNKKGTDLILQFKEHMTELADKMPLKNKYTQTIGKGTELKQSMVDVDLVALTGDYAQIRGAMTLAQNLPNNDKLSVKTGGGQRNVYHRQVRQSVDKEKEKKILNILVDKSLHKDYNYEVEHIFVVGHENAHSLGPNSNYRSALGIYSHVMEELKADIASLAFMPEYVKAGVIDKKTLKQIYVTEVGFRFFLKAKPRLIMPHRVAELIIFNYLLLKEAVWFNDEKKININFDIIGTACSDLLAEVIEVQLSKSPAAAKKFIDKYGKWGDFSKYIAGVLKKLGIKPYKEIKDYF